MKELNPTAPGSVAARTNTSQSYFNPWLLQFYDFTLYRFISPFLWGCSKEVLIERYNTHCSTKHLEVGPGTGYLLDNCQAAIEKLGLLDLSQACLNKTAKRLRRFDPSIWRRNILNPVEGIDEKYLSLSINYVLHCVPGNFAEKGIAISHLKQLLAEDGVLFGATVVKTNRSGLLAQSFMALLNKMGVFNNSQDTVDDLENELRRYFKFVKLETRTASVLFIATDSETSVTIHTNKVN